MWEPHTQSQRAMELCLCAGLAQPESCQGLDLDYLSNAWLKVRPQVQAVCKLLPFLSKTSQVPAVVPMCGPQTFHLKSALMPKRLLTAGLH